MRDKMEILEVINDFVDIETFQRSGRILNSFNFKEDGWYDILKSINEELKKRNLIGEFQNMFIEFGIDGYIKTVHIQEETRNIKDENIEIQERPDGNTIIRRRSLEDMEESIKRIKNNTIPFDVNEWKNHKRTKLMDRMLDDK